MDLFRTPGAALEGSDKKKFDETKELIDSATNDFLVRADWNANMGCVDKINSIHNVVVMNEVLFLLRKKLSTKVPQTVGLTMQLLGSMVNNCGTRFHAAINDEKFMRDVGNAIRYFSKRPGAENKDVTDVALDLVQSWGEAFLPQRRQFYHIVDLYFNLRKEGLPFKTQQFDPTRVPIFASNAQSSTGDDTDAILAAALQSSMAMEDEAQAGRHRGDRGGGHHHHRHDEQSTGTHRHRHGEEEYQDRRSNSSNSSAEVVASLASCMSILKEIILASTHQMDFRHNEVAQEVLTQLQSFQSQMPALIEQALMSDPDGVVSLFALNEDSQSLCNIYGKIKSLEISLAEGQRQAGAISCGGQPQATVSSHAPSGHRESHTHKHHHAHSPHRPTQGEPEDLLGLGDYSPRHTAVHSSPHHHEHLQEPPRQHQHHHRQHHEDHYPPEHNPPVVAQYAPQHYQPHPDGTGHGIRIPPPITQAPYGQAQAHQGYVPHTPSHGQTPVHAHHTPSHGQTSVHVHHTPSHGQTPVHAPNRIAPPPSARTPAHAPATAQAPVHAHPPVHAIPSDEIITVAASDPFAPDALDALFGETPVKAAPAPAPAPTSRSKAHAVSPGDAILPQPKDPFAPDALDALFGEAPVSAAKADPFSPQALDALFDAPVPQQAHVQGHHVQQAHHSHQTHHQTHQSHTSHVQYDQYGVPMAPPGSSPRAYHPSHAPQQASYPAAQYAPQYGHPPQQHQHQQQYAYDHQHAPQHAPQYAPQQHAYNAQYAVPPGHVVAPPPAQHYDTRQNPQYGGPSANPFDLMDS